MLSLPPVSSHLSLVVNKGLLLFQELHRFSRVTSDQPNGWKLDYDAYLEMKERLDEFEQRSRGVEAKNDQLYK